MKIKMGMKIKIAITNYQIYISGFIMNHVLKNRLWLPLGSLGLCGIWNTLNVVLTIIASNFNRKSTTYKQRKVAKARSGILELLLPPPTATQLCFQVIDEYMFYTNWRIITVLTEVPVHTLDMLDWRYSSIHSQPLQWASRTDRPGEEG
jgi:hypothetical protein